MKFSKEVKTALLVIFGIIFFIFGFNYLKGKNLLEASNNYYTEFDYNALTVGSPVTIKGNAIGKINAIEYIFETGKTKVSFSVDEKLKFSKTSKVRLYETGLMGGNAIAIIPSNNKDIAKPGDFLTSEVEQGLVTSLSKNFSGLSTGLDTTLKSADSLMISLNGLVQDNSEKGLKNALGELNSTIKSFKNLSNALTNLVSKNDASLTSVLNNFNTVSQDLAKLTGDLKQVELSKTIANLDGTLQSVNGLISDLDKGEGSMGKLLNDDKLYNNLEVASSQLKELLQDVKLNPKRYINVSVFGKKDKKGYVKPTDEHE